jgi:hypothetical protein
MPSTTQQPLLSYQSLQLQWNDPNFLTCPIPCFLPSRLTCNWSVLGSWKSISCPNDSRTIDISRTYSHNKCLHFDLARALRLIGLTVAFHNNFRIKEGDFQECWYEFYAIFLSDPEFSKVWVTVPFCKSVTEKTVLMKRKKKLKVRERKVNN